MVHALREPLLERDDELELLRELIAGASAPAGVVALVEGPAGIGKSSLLAQAQAIGHEAGFQTATARASELERGFAFGLVRQLFEPLLSATTAAQRERLFAGAAGLAAPLFENLDDDVRPRSEASHAVLHGLYWLTVNLATAGPIAVTVDDAHWADAPSMRFLAYLVNRVGDLRVFVAVGVRLSEPGAEVEVLDELAASPSTRVIRPAPLSADAVADVVHAVLAADPEPAFSAACFEATRGNPLLLRELLSTLAAEAIAPTAEQAAHVLDVAPRSVARSVARRLRSLTPEAGKVARAVAVLGDGTELSAAAKLAGLDPPSAAAGAEALGRADILSRDALEFVHPVVRAAVYSELSPPQRAGEHRAAASILADQGAAEDQIALHVLAGDPGGDEWATAVLRRAARRARARGAPDIAATYLQRAISEPPRGDERGAVLVELALAELAAGRVAGLGPCGRRTTSRRIPAPERASRLSWGGRCTRPAISPRRPRCSRTR
jgi:predicted ATPase